MKCRPRYEVYVAANAIGLQSGLICNNSRVIAWNFEWLMGAKVKRAALWIGPGGSRVHWRYPRVPTKERSAPRSTLVTP
eukprot:2197775-Amphidinium_carterae.1